MSALLMIMVTGNIVLTADLHNSSWLNASSAIPRNPDVKEAENFMKSFKLSPAQ